MGNLVTTLLSIARKHRGKVSDKWESHFPVYEALFQPFRAKPISLLEIAKARNNLGILFFQQGRNKEAIAQFAEAARLDPSFAEARKLLDAPSGNR